MASIQQTPRRYPINPLKGAEYSYSNEWAFIPWALLVDMQASHLTNFCSPSRPCPAC